VHGEGHSKVRVWRPKHRDDGGGLSPEALLFLMHGIPKMIQLEEAVGLSIAHDRCSGPCKDVSTRWSRSGGVEAPGDDVEKRAEDADAEGNPA
jgi:hypothetical protein